MLDRDTQSIQSVLLGCLACLLMITVANADGRVFVLDLRNSSGLQGFRDAEQACASQHARLASAEELRHAVVECFFSPCTRGWLYGATVGTTLCNIVGGALKAVDVRIENSTEAQSDLDAFCSKDKEVLCGDPPSFPNAHLQTHSGLEIGDELLYTCVPGYVMPSGQSAFSLLCDSCGEWYGLVQICIKDDSSIHVDYEDKFTDSFSDAEHRYKSPELVHNHMQKEVDGAASVEEKMSQEQHETGFSVKVVEEGQGQHGKQEMKGQVKKFKEDVEGRQTDEEQAVQDFIGHPAWEQERSLVVGTDAVAATEASVSLLSQKHMFWFPSEAFQKEGLPVSTNPVTQSTQRSSGSESEESKEHLSKEWHNHDRDRASFNDQDTDDGDDRETVDGDDNEDSHYDRDEHDSHQDEDDHDDHVIHNIPAQHEDVHRRDSHEKHEEDHDDRYDMGEREDDRVYDDQDGAFGKHESHEDHEDVTDDGNDDDDNPEHPRGSEEHPDHDDHDDGEEHYDLDKDDIEHYTDHDGQDHHDHDSYDDPDSLEDDDHQRVMFSRAKGQQQNITQKTVGGKTTTDETWLDGYPVVPEDTKNSTAGRVRSGLRERGTVVRTTDRPNEVEIRRPVPFSSLPELHEFPTTGPKLAGPREEVLWPGFVATAAPSPDHLEPSESLSYSDTLDYDTQQAAPTHSWLGDLTEHPFLDHGPAPPVHEGDILTGVMEEHTMHSLPSETGERDNVEGERGETICAGDDCPPRPPSSSTQGPKVAAIIVAVCALATAVIIGVWCYRRQQQKSSMYEMNGKGQSPSRQAQQIEMQPKV